MDLLVSLLPLTIILVVLFGGAFLLKRRVPAISKPLGQMPSLTCALIGFAVGFLLSFVNCNATPSDKPMFAALWGVLLAILGAIIGGFSGRSKKVD